MTYPKRGALFTEKTPGDARSGSCRVSRGMDAGATRCLVSESVDPFSEECAREGLSRGASAMGT